MNKFSFDQVKRLSTPIRNGIVLLGFVLFALIFFLEYTYSTKHGDVIGSVIYAIPFPMALTIGLLNITLNDKDTHIPWYRRLNVLLGLMLLLFSVICLLQLVNSLMNNNLPDAVALSIEGVSLLLLLLVFVRLVVVRRSVDGFRRD